MKRRLITLFLALMMVVAYSTPVLNSNVEVYATSKTADDAIAWLKSKVGTGINYDGKYGCQCVDLTMAYYTMLGVDPVWENGKGYASNKLPSGWSRSKGGKPHKGDILVYGATADNEYGHVAIFESTNVSYHQNYAGKKYVVRVTNRNYKTSNYWGCIRPNWSNSKVSIVYNVNGGIQSIPSEKVLFGKTFYTPAANSTTKVGYTLAGFNCYRYKDDTYYVSGTGWIKAANIGNYTKALYKPGSSHKMSNSWIYDGDFINYNKLRFDAVWKGNNHTISFNSNGAKGTAPSKLTVPTGKKFTIPKQGKMTKKYGILPMKLKGWTVVRNSDKKYYAKDKKWYANTEANLKKHPAMVYECGSKYTLGANAWLSNNMKNTNASFTFKAVWKVL